MRNLIEVIGDLEERHVDLVVLGKGSPVAAYVDIYPTTPPDAAEAAHRARS